MTAWISAGLALLWIAAGTAFLLLRRTRSREAAEALENARREGESQAARLRLEAQEAISQRRRAWEAELAALRGAAADREARLGRLMNQAESRAVTLGEREAAQQQVLRELDQLRSAQAASSQQIAGLRSEQRKALLDRSGMAEEEARQTYLRQLEAVLLHETGERVEREVLSVQGDAEERGRIVLHTVLHRIRTQATLEPQHNTAEFRPETVERWLRADGGALHAKLKELTGVEMSQEPETGEVRFTAYDGVWREVAKLVVQESDRRGTVTLENLPDVVRQQEATLTRTLGKTARRFLERMRLRDIHPDIVQAMGRLRFRTSYGQNILEHSVEAGYIAAHLASEVGLDPRLAMRCGLLHDLGKALTTAEGGLHDDLGADLAKKCGEHEAVIGAIDGHHGANNNPYTKLAMAGDAISGARPGARRETYEKYVERINQLQAIAASFPEVRSVDLMKAGREVRAYTAPSGMTDEEVTALAGRIAERIEQDVIYPGEIHVTAIKETKAVEKAR